MNRWGQTPSIISTALLAMNSSTLDNIPFMAPRAVMLFEGAGADAPFSFDASSSVTNTRRIQLICTCSAKWTWPFSSSVASSVCIMFVS